MEPPNQLKLPYATRITAPQPGSIEPIALSGRNGVIIRTSELDDIAITSVLEKSFADIPVRVSSAARGLSGRQEYFVWRQLRGTLFP
jgi:hypothetical protein